MPIQIYSFFSGVGFLDLGFQNVGFDIAFVDEYDERFLRAYQLAEMIPTSHGMDIAIWMCVLFCPMMCGIKYFLITDSKMIPLLVLSADHLARIFLLQGEMKEKKGRTDS